MFGILSFIFFMAAFILAIFAFPSFNTFIKKIIKRICTFSKKHWHGILITIIIVLALILKDFTVNILAPLSQLAIIVLGITILLGAVSKKTFKHAWKIGSLAITLIFLTVILSKLPW